jgi:hypothetical protein
VISFRYHVVTIVAVLLALAAGVVLGAGPLRGDSDRTLTKQVEADKQVQAGLRRQAADLRSGNVFTDEFADTVAPGLLAEVLTGRVVTVLSMPTARAADVASVKKLVGTAGGTVGGTVRVGTKLVDVGSKQLVDELGNQLESRAPRVRIPADATPYERIGALLARAIGTPEKGGAAVDSPATSIMAGLSTTDLVSPQGRLSRRGDLVLMVTGPGEGSSAQQRGAATVVAELAKAVDGGTGGVVLAGPPTTAAATGQVGAVRRDVSAAREVSTVDALGRSAGDVVAVLALAGQAAGETGQYGAVDAADGAMPGGRSSTQ